jgi:hypothetical protein
MKETYLKVKKKSALHENLLISYQKHKFMIQTFQSFDTQEAPFVRLPRVGSATTIPHKIPTIV